MKARGMGTAAAAVAALGLGASACKTSKVEHPKPGASSSTATIPREGDKPPIGSSPQPIFGKDGIKKLQAALRKRGFSAPRDGDFGADTQKALRAFQEKEGLAPTGMPDLETTRRLGLDTKELYGP